MKNELKLLYPLDIFYTEAEMPLPKSEPIPGEEVPEPYRYLLVNDHDMTPTLETFHGEPIHLRLIRRRVEENALARLVVLTLNGSMRPVEFGAIIIHTRYFPEAAREEILRGRSPLGTIMRVHNVRHRSCPQAFLRLTPDSFISDELRLEGLSALYGRRNILVTPENQTLADIIEILPPARNGENGT